MRYLRYLLALAFFVSSAATLLGQDSSDEFQIALTGRYPPFSMPSADGDLVGFDMDVSAEIADRMGRDLVVIQTEWDGILPGLLAGRYDAIIGSMAITEEREKSVNFSAPYYISGAQLFIRDSDATQFQRIDDMAGQPVGVVLGTTFEQFLSNQYPDVSIQTYKSETDIYQDMEVGRLSGFVTDKLVGMYQISAAEKSFQPAGPLLYEETMGIPVVKERPELLEEINAALDQMHDDGTFDDLHRKWFKGDIGSRTTVVTNSLIAKKLFSGFAVTLWVAFASLTLGFLLSIPTGLALHHDDFALRPVIRAVVDFIRGTPVLIQLFFVYYGGPQIGIVLSPITAAIFALTINAAAYMAEVIRSGLMAVDKGQALAARSLGLTPTQAFFHVIWPQAFRIALPPLVNSAVALLKDTALVSVITVSEVIQQAQSLISITYNPMEIFFIVGLMFFIFTFPLMMWAKRLEDSIKKKGFL